MKFKYYNANPFGRNVNDCTIRAISLAVELSWEDTYMLLAEYGRKNGITFSEVDFIDEFLCHRYKRFCPNKDVKTVEDFVNLDLSGRWLITMNGHITAVIDGVLYDTFDCSDRYIWSIYRVK